MSKARERRKLLTKQRKAKAMRRRAINRRLRRQGFTDEYIAECLGFADCLVPQDCYGDPTQRFAANLARAKQC